MNRTEDPKMGGFSGVTSPSARIQRYWERSCECRFVNAYAIMGGAEVRRISGTMKIGHVATIRNMSMLKMRMHRIGSFDGLGRSIVLSG